MFCPIPLSLSPSKSRDKVQAVATKGSLWMKSSWTGRLGQTGMYGKSPWKGRLNQCHVSLSELSTDSNRDSDRQTGLPFWPTILSVEPLARCVVCRLSVCLSVCLSVTFCIVAKCCVLAKKCLKEWIGNQGQKVHFFGRRHISTSGFAATATKAAVFALFLLV